MTIFSFHSNAFQKLHFSTILLAATFSIASTPHAKDLQSYGGQGGDTGYRLECPPGTLLTGFLGQAGTHISQLSIECRRFDAQKGSLGDMVSVLSDPQGSRIAGRALGGGSRRRVCGEHQIIYTVDFLFARHGPIVLEQLHAGCMDVKDSRRPLTGIDFTSSDGSQLSDSTLSYPRSGWQTCSQGELPSGVYGTGGLYVDSIGLTCRPSATSPTTSDQESQGIYSWPFTTVRPANGQAADRH